MEAIHIGNYASSKIADEVVIQRVLGGEKELFEILLRRYNQTLYRVVRSYLPQDADIEDAMQNAYMLAFEKLHQFQGNSGFSTWLIRIGINEALGRIRSMKKEGRYVGHDDVEEKKILQLSDMAEMNPEKETISLEIRTLIEKVIDELPEKYRVVYMLKEVEGMKNSEIAECLDLSESNVKVRLHRAKGFLQQSLLRISSKAEIFEFGNKRCDNIVNFVMGSI